MIPPQSRDWVKVAMVQEDDRRLKKTVRSAMFRRLMTSKIFKTASIEMAIEALADDRSQLGTAFREISYDDVIQYIKMRQFYAQGAIWTSKVGMVRFYPLIEGRLYLVLLNVTSDGKGSVLVARRLDMAREASRLFGKDHADIMTALGLPVKHPKYENLLQFDSSELPRKELFLAGVLVQKFFERNPRAFYPLFKAHSQFHDPDEDAAGVLDVLRHPGTEDAEVIRLQCCLAVQALMTKNWLPCFQIVDLQRLSEMISELETT